MRSAASADRDTKFGHGFDDGHLGNRCSGRRLVSIFGMDMKDALIMRHFVTFFAEHVGLPSLLYGLKEKD